MSETINGKQLASQITDEVKSEINKTHIQPTLAVILVGDDPASVLYIKKKAKACAEVGINLI